MRRRLGVARLVVVVEARAGLLAAPALLAQDFADRRALRRRGRPADVEAGEIAHREGAHRQAEVDEHAVDVPGRRAFEDELHRLALALSQHAVADEAMATPTTTPTLPIFGASWVMVASTDFDVFAPRTISSRRITLAGEKKCVPSTSSGRLVIRGDRVDVEVGGVGGEDRAGLGDRVEPLEDAFLEVHVLEHRFDHEVGVSQAH